MMNKLIFNPPVIAHRGASGYAPENTMLAFTQALLLGVKWIEFDVMLAKDGVPVIFHDENLERTTNGKGYLYDYPYAYLRSLDAGAWFATSFSGEKIPSLDELLYFLQNNTLSANIEIKAKAGDEETLVKCVLAKLALFLKDSPSSLLFSSFSLEALSYLRKYAPNCQLGFLMDEWQADWRSSCDTLRCVSVHVNEEILTEARAHEIKASGRALLSYTVNDPKRAKTLFSYGVDAVFSDFPDKIFHFLNK